ncbi:MAG: hypothetical protein JNM66_28750 [Bryobacterales bacterium]|nr:hypothetical protein [Bryobacterales bacterium]
MRALVPFFALTLAAADFPTLEIASEHIRATILPPDPAKGYYQGTRFDWSGAILSLRYAGHEYFGQWFEKYDPRTHDAIAGPVEEFRSVGFEEAEPGGTFVRVGIGAVRRPDTRPYQTFKTYEIADYGKWSVTPSSSSVEFVHTLAANGYSYRYTKLLRFVPGKPEMVIEHTLQNTGAKGIHTTQYNHNFFVIDGQPTGPESVIRFPFDVRPDRDLKGLARGEGQELRYTRELAKGESVYTELAGFGPTADSYDFAIENRAARAGVRITGDRPLSKVVYWSIRTTTCPEPYIQLDVEPGQQTRWRYTYTFYTLPPK